MEKVVHVHKAVQTPTHPTDVFQKSVLDPFQVPNKVSKSTKYNVVLVIAGILVVLLGMGTGKILVGSTSSGSPKSNALNTLGSPNKSDTSAGVSDESIFKDTGIGILEKGGVDGEGTHHLVRDGGPTKYIYLSSTVLDLESFMGKKVQVWGQTIAGKKAGWLMDVGKVKVVE